LQYLHSAGAVSAGTTGKCKAGSIVPGLASTPTHALRKDAVGSLAARHDVAGTDNVDIAAVTTVATTTAQSLCKYTMGFKESPAVA